MILFPAIDLKDGQCVRLKLGDMAQATVFNDDPAAQAHELRAPGLLLAASRRSQWRLRRPAGEWRGRRGDPQGRDDSGAARRRHPQPGADRDLARARASAASSSAPWRCAIRTGARGLPAVSGPHRGRHRCASGGRVAVEGWAETSDLTAIDLARRFADAGVAAIIFTDIDRDGVLKGLNIDSTLELAPRRTIPVIASGGLASIDGHPAPAAARLPHPRRRHLGPRPL